MENRQFGTHSARIDQSIVPVQKTSQQGMTTNHFLFILVSSAISLTIASVWILRTSHKRTLKAKLIDEIQPSKIPCPQCQFYNRNPALRCAVHPLAVHTEQSVNCPDYCPNHTNAVKQP